MTFNKRLPTLLGGGVLLMSLLLAAGCGSSAVTVSMAGTSNQNSCGDDASGNFATVLVLELANKTKFVDVTRETFWSNAAALGDEELGRQNYRLGPGGREDIPAFEPRKETRFVGVAADLRCPDDGQWRQVLPIEDLKGKRLAVEIGKNRVLVDVR